MLFHDQLSKGEGFTEVVIVAIGSVDYLAVFRVNTKNLTVCPNGKGTRLANTSDTRQVITGIFPDWYFYLGHVASLKTFDALNQAGCIKLTVFLLSSESKLIGVTNLTLSSPHSLDQQRLNTIQFQFLGGGLPYTNCVQPMCLG